MVEVEERAEDHVGPSEITAWPQAPVYDLAALPRELTSINVPELQSEVRDNFCRLARWCADGSSVLTISEDRIIRVFDTPTSSDNEAGPSFSTPRTFAQPDAIHATAWFPSAAASASETFCFAASIRDTPVRLVDATDGRIRATYPIIDHRERMIAPHSLAWNPTATKLYCGHESAIEVLDIASPGDAGERWKTSYTRKEKGNQKGIISTLAFCPDYSGLFAAGSFAGNVSLYSEDTGSTAVAHLEGIKGGGVTQVAFHPLSPQTLFVTSRRCNVIQVFDIRNPSSGPFMEFERKGMTNQRIWFDVDPWGRYLASGDEQGTLKIWDVGHAMGEVVHESKVASDTIGSVQLHTYKPFVLLASGSRSHKYSEIELSDDEDESEDDDSDLDAESVGSDVITRESPSQHRDASIRILSFSARSDASST